MNIIDILRNELGEFTQGKVSSVCHQDQDRLLALVAPVARYYWDWLETVESDRQPALASPCYHGVSTQISESPRLDLPLDLKEFERQLKQQILYFPQITVIDPFAELVWPVASLAVLLQSMGDSFGFTDDQFVKFAADAHRALSRLVLLQPFVDSGAVLLVPRTYAFDYTSMQDAARLELGFLGDTSLRGILRYHSEMQALAERFQLPLSTPLSTVNSATGCI
jgi:hypothetical protein